MLYEMLASHGFEQPYNLPYFREFSLTLDKPIETKSLLRHMINKGFLFGAVLARYHTVSLNEHHSQQALEGLISSIEEVIG
jgi:glycine cleavage system pyridoxal-binding protein P